VPLHLHLRDGGLDRELLAIGPQAAEGPQMAHGAGGLAGLAEVADVLPVRLAETVRDEPLDVRAQGLGRRAAEHLLRRRVEQDNLLVLADGDDRIHRRIDEARQAPLALGEGLLRLLAGGDVVVGLQDGDRRALGIAVDDPLADHGDPAAILAGVFEFAGPVPFGQHLRADLLGRLREPRPQHLVADSAGDLVVGVAVDPRGPAVPVDDVVIEVADQHVGQPHHAAVLGDLLALLGEGVRDPLPPADHPAIGPLPPPAGGQRGADHPDQFHGAQGSADEQQVRG
jgi:hypothetical protein